METKKRGGFRVGAGRPRSLIEKVNIKIVLPKIYKPILKELGGSKWVENQITYIKGAKDEGKKLG